MVGRKEPVFVTTLCYQLRVLHSNFSGKIVKVLDDFVDTSFLTKLVLLTIFIVFLRFVWPIVIKS